MPTLLEISTKLFLQIAVILAAYRLLWPLLRRLAQVQVMAIMVAGFLLGPSALGWIWPGAQQWLFPQTLEISGTAVQHPNLTVLYMVGQIGLVLFMFMVGASFDLTILGAHLRKASITSATGIVVPLLLGGAAGWWMAGSQRWFTDAVAPWQAALFLAAAVAVTAFPVLAWIIRDAGLVRTRLGTLSLASAALDDAVAWLLLAVVVATAQASPGGAVLACAGGVCFVLIMAFLARPLLARLRDAGPAQGERTGGLPVGPLVVILIVVLLSASFTDFVGIHSVLGAFVAGLVMPRGTLIDRIRDRVDPLVSYLLLPAFFIYTGLNTELALIFEPVVLAMALLVLLLSFAGKFGAIGLAARWQGMSWREAGTMGALANARGLMELVLINIGLAAGLITPELFTVLALMTFVTTAAATPLQRLFERSAWKQGRVFGPDGEQPKPVPRPHEVGSERDPTDHGRARS
ncbi:cation:proton antiporter [Nocardia puris]|uniref:Transporter (CPA2 family) n=1 Tax=Nocardia puris TaxID=208602 RepID=A0A366E393_9NOCA|nr:cation:proton antiporter [Nocardia puris]MBF6214395.1 cation:proton antiporter [Nocardia puris]MBF6369010.1 cation:proton antiporter [Nocardia puris]MBF6462842.1 cation:proton antiporter [Nocardia puris]RBO96777.1 transporter (CPA2 family) [Nocardia puris]